MKITITISEAQVRNLLNECLMGDEKPITIRELKKPKVVKALAQWLNGWHIEALEQANNEGALTRNILRALDRECEESKEY